MVNEAFFALMEGVAAPEDIDRGMRLGTNHPMGPLTLADFIGADLTLNCKPRAGPPLMWREARTEELTCIHITDYLATNQFVYEARKCAVRARVLT